LPEQGRAGEPHVEQRQPMEDQTGRVEDKKIWLHAAFVGMFLAVAHVATPRSMTRAPASITLNGPQVDPSRNRPYSGQTLPSLLDYLAWEA